MSIIWPSHKRFAFTIVDDTDRSTVKNTKPIYELLRDLGFRTTKTVWPLDPSQNRLSSGESLQDPDYSTFVRWLRSEGFEIALHGAADSSSERDTVKAALDAFTSLLGAEPSVHVNHVGQKEGIYWGQQRFDGLPRLLYRVYRRTLSQEPEAEGHLRDSKYFWGDICQSHIKYVRNFVFQDINTLKCDPFMPYHDSRRPFVRNWFSSSNGSGCKQFCRLLSEKNQDLLMEEGGACIVYTHFGSTFYPVPHTVRSLLTRLSKLPGWFVPVTDLLDHIAAIRGVVDVAESKWSHQTLQGRWIIQTLLHTAKTELLRIGPAKLRH